MYVVRDHGSKRTHPSDVFSIMVDTDTAGLISVQVNDLFYELKYVVGIINIDNVTISSISGQSGIACVILRHSSGSNTHELVYVKRGFTTGRNLIPFTFDGDNADYMCTTEVELETSSAGVITPHSYQSGDGEYTISTTADILFTINL